MERGREGTGEAERNIEKADELTKFTDLSTSRRLRRGSV